MAGRHEPSSRASFYLSLSTAALRATLVLGAIALGIFVLAKAFPTGAGSVPPIATDASPEETTPADTGNGDDGGNDGENQGTAEPPDVSGLEIQVLNGTDVSGLAECTATELEELEGFQDVIFGDASGSSYPRSQINFVAEVRDVAVYLKATYFKRAELVTAKGSDVKLSVILGDEYADRPLQPCR